VSELFGLIKQLNRKENNEDRKQALENMVEMLHEPVYHEILACIPMILDPSMTLVFEKALSTLGIELSMTSEGFLRTTIGVNQAVERLEQQQTMKRKKKSTREYAAVIKDPQCIVCYEVSKHAHAAPCGHICCSHCWQKVWLKFLLYFAVLNSFFPCTD